MILIREMMGRMRKEKNKCWAYRIDDKKLNYGPLRSAHSQIINLLHKLGRLRDDTFESSA